MRKTLTLVLCLFVSGQMAVVAQDWPQWRGPARDGSVSAASAPAAWPASYVRGWRADIGEGYSSPVVAGNRVFVHSRKDPSEIVTAIDLASGKSLWQHTYDAPYAKNSYATKMAKGPNATPLVAGGRLFTLGATGKLAAWDAPTGRSLWQKDFSAAIDTSKMFCGTAASPLLSGGLLIIQVGSDVKGGQILALDPATGVAKWEWRGLGPGYASPVVIDVAGTSQIVTMTNGSVLGLDARTGRELWTAPFPDEWHENIATPVWTGTDLIVSGTRQGTHAYRLVQEGGAWRATSSWKNADVTMYMSSPVYGDGLVYGLSAKRRGQFVALDAKTGALKWATEGREGEHASILLLPRHVVFLSNTGTLAVARRGTAAFELEKKYEAIGTAGEAWAMPAFLGTSLIVRDATGVMRLNGK